MEFHRKDVPLYLVAAAAVTTLVSIRVFEILMAAALIALVVTRRRWRLPPVWLPLSLFLLGTLVSLFVSGHIREGLPQVRKFYVYLMLFLVTSAFRTVSEVRWLAIGLGFGRDAFFRYGRCCSSSKNIAPRNWPIRTFTPLTWTPASPDSWAIG